MLSTIETTTHIRVPAYDVPGIVQAFIRDGAPIGLDTEASSVDTWEAKPILLQLGDTQNIYICDLRHLDAAGWEHIARAVRLLLSGLIEVRGHNLKYDLLLLAVQCGLSPEDFHSARLYDSMLAEQVLLGGVDAEDGSGRERASLEAACARRGIALPKDPRRYFVGLDARPEWDTSIPGEQLDYAARDISVLFPIAEAQEREAGETGSADTLLLEMACLPAVIAMELAGIQVDVEGWREYLARVKEQADDLESRIQASLYPAWRSARARLQQQQSADCAEWTAAQDATLDTAHAAYDAQPSPKPKWGDVRKRVIADFRAAHPKPPTPAPLPDRLNLNSPAQLLEALRLIGVHLTDT